jgi:hypothetical protein
MHPFSLSRCAFDTHTHTPVCPSRSFVGAVATHGRRLRETLTSPHPRANSALAIPQPHHTPATSNVASTAAGALSLLPVPYRPSDPDSLYNKLLPHQAVLPVKLSLVGKFTGNRTGSSKADAYLWAKEAFLDTGVVTGSTLAYFVDYFAAVGAPSATTLGATRAHVPPDHIIQGQTLAAGQSLLSSNGAYALLVQHNGSLAIVEVGSSHVLWSTTAGVTPNDCQLSLASTGDASVACGSTITWSSKTSGTGGAFWLWMQHDGNLVLYQGKYPGPGKVLWSSNTAVSCAAALSCLSFGCSTPPMHFKSGDLGVHALPY